MPARAELTAGVVAVPVANLASVGGPDGVSMLVPKRGGAVRDGELVAWCAVVTVAPATVGVDGDLAVEGWLPDHARLGLLEQHIGDGLVEQVVAKHCPRPTLRQRLMSTPLVARLVIALTLLPNASYVDALAQVVGLLPRLPWVRSWHVPSSTVITEWRRRLGVAAMHELFTRVAGHIVAATDPDALWHGLRVCALDGTQVRVPASQANRAAFGSAGTNDNTSPFPQVRVVLATARAGRALLAAAFDKSKVGEQTLAANIAKTNPDLFTPDHVYLVDRNFFSFPLIEAIHQNGRGAHLVMRVREWIKVPVIQPLPDGTYLTRLKPPGRADLTARVVEYHVTLPDNGTSELFRLVTTLTDHDAYPAADIAELYPQRWSASETTVGENKSTITDAGPGRGPNLRSEEPELIEQELWAWLTGTQLLRKAAYAITQTTTGVSTDQISFTTMRREATRSMTQTRVTATSTPADLHIAADHAARGVLANLITIGRDRHSRRLLKSRPRFNHTGTTKITTRGPLNISLKPTIADTS